MSENLEQVIPDYFERVTKHSWTWERLTDAEKERFCELDFFCIKGNKKQRLDVFMLVYNAFLAALGYSWSGWRETESEKDGPKF